MIILIGFASSLLVFFVFFWVFSNADTKETKALAATRASLANKNFTISSKDIETIAGDDVMTTQLDLARAYIETERKNLARSILKNVLQHGSMEQKQEAKRLIANLQLVS